MKLIYVLFLVSFTTAPAFADTLQCWKTNFATAKTPFMTATITDNDILQDVTFPYKNAPEANIAGALRGTVITSNHSPYKGNTQYALTNGDTLILPSDLSQKNLETLLASGIGFYKNENGAIIGFSHDGDSEGGNHFSYRLKCTSDKSAQ